MEKIKKTLLFFCLFQIILVIAFFLSEKLLSQEETYLGRGFGEQVNKPLVWSRANFDGFHYLFIARSGMATFRKLSFLFFRY